MDGFNNKFIKLVNELNEGNILTEDLDKYVQENSDKNIFSKCILSLMDSNNNLVKIYAAKYSYYYNIDKKKSYFICRYILRREKNLNARIEAKSIYDSYKRRYIRKIIDKISRKKK